MLQAYTKLRAAESVNAGSLVTWCVCTLTLPAVIVEAGTSKAKRQEL